MEGNQDNDRPAAVEEQEVANLFNVSPDIAVPLAARENRPGVLKQLIQEGKPVHVKDTHGWTALHHAAFLGHTECVSVLLNEETCKIDDQASEGLTPLTAACANLPTSKECVKVLCEHKANPNLLTTNMGIMFAPRQKTALHIALEIKPDLEVIKWLVRAVAHMEKQHVPLWGDDLVASLTPTEALAVDLDNDLMMCLFKGELVTGWAIHPAYNSVTNTFEHLKPEVSEVAEIAMYLAKNGAVRNALAAVLLFFTEGYILMPQSLDEIVECFLEHGAVLNAKAILDQDYYVFRPSVFFHFARKSIMFIERVPTSPQIDMNVVQLFNTLMVLIIKGKVSGTLPFTAVKEIHDNLKYDLGEHMPKKFRPLETLYAMTNKPPSLSQLARTKIRTQVAECGKFCRENIKKLPLPEILKDFVQLANLEYGSDLEEIMKVAKDLQIC